MTIDAFSEDFETLDVNTILVIQYGTVTHIADDHAQTVLCDDGQTLILRNIIERAGGAVVGDRLILRRTKLRHRVAWVASRKR